MSEAADVTASSCSGRGSPQCDSSLMSSLKTSSSSTLRNLPDGGGPPLAETVVASSPAYSKAGLNPAVKVEDGDSLFLYSERAEHVKEGAS